MKKYLSYKICFTSIFFIFVLPLFLISCKNESKEVGYNREDYVNYKEFNDFKVSILNKISNNNEDYKISNKLLLNNAKKYLKDIKGFNDRLLRLKIQRGEDIDRVVGLEKEIIDVRKSYKDLSDKVEKSADRKRKEQAKIKVPNKFPFYLSGIAIWGGHYIVYMRVRDKYVPMRITDKLDNWVLAEIDYSMRCVVFNNLQTKKTIVRNLL